MDSVMAIVLFANPWSFEDERTGQRKEGITVEYVMSEDLKPVVNEDGSVGLKTYRDSLHISKMPEIMKVPGIYEMFYGFSNVKGKPVMKLQGMKFVSEV